jgi:hypothetical protein
VGARNINADVKNINAGARNINANAKNTNAGASFTFTGGCCVKNEGEKILRAYAKPRKQEACTFYKPNKKILFALTFILSASSEKSPNCLMIFF